GLPRHQPVPSRGVADREQILKRTSPAIRALPLSPCGRGWLVASETSNGPVEGFALSDTPHPPRQLRSARHPLPQGERVSECASGTAALFSDRERGKSRIRYVSSPVGTFLFSLVSFMPAASAKVSSSAAKSCCRYASGSGFSVAAPKCVCRTSRALAVTGIGTSSSRPSASPRSRSLRSSSGVNVVVQSRLTSAGVL